MKRKLTLYEMVYAYSTTWLEMAMEAYPLTTGAALAVVLWALFL